MRLLLIRIAKQMCSNTTLLYPKSAADSQELSWTVLTTTSQTSPEEQRPVAEVAELSVACVPRNLYADWLQNGAA